MENREVLVIIPAFNEAERIGAVIEGIRSNLPHADVLVIDDGSGDRTTEVSRRAGARVASLPFNLGVGAALQTGYKFAVKWGYRSVIQLDADGQHDPLFVPVFLEAIRTGDNDLIIGSRFLAHKYYETSLIRRSGIAFFSFLVSLLIRQRLTDPTSGYRAMKKPVLEFCAQDAYTFDYPDADFLLAIHKAGFKITEIPVRMNPRTGGQSQHRGLKPLYYIFKMTLSILVNLLRRSPVHRK